MAKKKVVKAPCQMSKAELEVEAGKKNKNSWRYKKELESRA